MSNTGAYSRITVLSTFILGGVLGALVMIAFTVVSGFSVDDTEARMSMSDTPGMDTLDFHRCPAGQKKIQFVRGVEDGFSRAGEEPATMRPFLSELPFYDYLHRNMRPFHLHRNFDEIGLDKTLMSYIDFPPKIASGILVIRYKTDGNFATDSIRISDQQRVAQSTFRPLELLEFNVSIASIENGSVGILNEDVAQLKFSEFEGYWAPSGIDDLQEFFLMNDKAITLDVTIQDDTRVDFFGVSLCQKPLERRGTTLSVDSREIVGEGLALVQCDSDYNQKPCDPQRGDILCSAHLPLGCYKTGDRPRPSDIGYASAAYVGGEIRTTAPIMGEQLSSVDKADELCLKSFGTDWRTLSWHEAGGALVLAHADIPPKTRMWVEVKDQPAATCWRNGPSQ